MSYPSGMMAPIGNTGTKYRGLARHKFTPMPGVPCDAAGGRVSIKINAYRAGLPMRDVNRFSWRHVVVSPMTLNDNPYESPQELAPLLPSTPQERDGPIVSIVLCHLTIVALHIFYASVATERLTVLAFVSNVLDYAPYAVALGTCFAPVVMLYFLVKREFSIQTRVTSIFAECFFLCVQTAVFSGWL